ncbi:MAG TPA: amidophosphoribosyltransferase [bacterium]|nr:amidophosphoribosyltransferase [bacterium]HPP29922.1 amidophosphoribosyltransferase [bacterium]
MPTEKEYGLKENCGVAGIYNHRNSSEIIYLSLFSLQHRGQESCGIVVCDGKKVHIKKGMGTVSDVFKEGDISALKGSFGIGHVRYSTTGSSSVKNIQPFFAEYQGKPYAIAHNGNIVNSAILREKLEKRGSIFQTTLDTEVLMHLITVSRKKTFREKLIDALYKLKGAFAFVILTSDSIIAVKDPWDFRPLCLGKIGDSYLVASESCAFDLTGAEYIRELSPGEILTINEKGLDSVYIPPQKISRCIFEFIYFARPDSNIFGVSVYNARKRLGERLADEFPYEGDIVVPIPDSGNIAALGFSQKRGIPFEMGIVRNHYVGRTFIQPFQVSREISVKVKLNPIKEVVKDKNVIVIEDSIVRGTTSRLRIRNLRDAGAKKIFMGVSCPPIRYPCFYGIDFPFREELIAGRYNTEKIAKEIGVDGLYYLSLDGMLSAIGLSESEFCNACFTGRYNVKNNGFSGKEQFECDRK